jgi:hypothetical protein
MTNLIQDPPTRYARPENMRRVLGFRSPGVLQALLRSPRLTRRIDERLEVMLGEPPRLPPGDLRLAEVLLTMPEDRFQQVARIVAVLTQAKAIRRTVCGRQLATVADFCGNKHILRFVRDHDLPVFAGIRPCATLDEATLQSQTASAACFLFGLLPRNFQLRLVLHRAPGQLGGVLDCPTPEAREALKTLVEAALAFLAGRDGAGPAA